MATLELTAPVPLADLRATLARTCPDLALQGMGPGVTASRSPWVAAWVMTQRKQVQVVPMVRSIPMMLLFLLVALTGVGLLVYAVAVLPRQRQVVDQVVAALERELRSTGAARAA